MSQKKNRPPSVPARSQQSQIVQTESARAVSDRGVNGDVQNRSAKLQANGKEFRAEVYQGLVPHPDHVERYEQLCPGSTDRFIGMAERQGAHRQQMEKRFLSFNGASQILGVVFAGLISICALGIGGYLVYSEKEIEGFTAMFVPLATIAGIFVYSKRQAAAEKAQTRPQR